MKSNLEKSLIAASLINTLFYSYEQGELNKSGELIRKRVSKLMRARSKSNNQLLMNAIKTTDEAWRATINHFAKANTPIEAKSTISAIYDYFSEDLKRFASITEKHMENFSINSTCNVQASRNSKMVIDYLIVEMGMEKRVSLFKGKKLLLRGNMVTDGINIKEGF